ncbi:unnamed protein product [Prorocentrum cordatum]|uniref:Uncharacterized protein n=1 Tax=Prorocentrum cordatum TaxID=2364126 RepID=A0ABN9TMP5_9DINO|nr:unnamed protein product [Polarella glacialis]
MDGRCCGGGVEVYMGFVRLGGGTAARLRAGWALAVVSERLPEEEKADLPARAPRPLATLPRARMAAAAQISVKTEKGLAELNGLLATRSFVGGTAAATPEDFAQFSKIHVLPDRELYPHLLRWFKQVKALRAHAADHAELAAAGPGAAPAAASAPKQPKGRAAGKERQVLAVDCKPLQVKDPIFACQRPSAARPPSATNACPAATRALRADITSRRRSITRTGGLT